MAEFKEKTIPEMFGVLQKHVKDGHFIGSNGVSSVCMHVHICVVYAGMVMCVTVHTAFYLS